MIPTPPPQKKIAKKVSQNLLPPNVPNLPSPKAKTSRKQLVASKNMILRAFLEPHSRHGVTPFNIMKVRTKQNEPFNI